MLNKIRNLPIMAEKKQEIFIKLENITSEIDENSI